MGITEDFQEKELKVVNDNKGQIKIRSVKFPNDLTHTLSNKSTVLELKQLVRHDKVRFFYSGREMKDHHMLGSYNLPPEPV